jgi:hypothetical protein
VLLARRGLGGPLTSVATGRGLRDIGPAMVTIGPQCWRNTMTVPECMLSVDVEGCKNESASCGRAAAV